MALHGVPNFSIENTRQGDEIHSAQVHPEGGVSVRRSNRHLGPMLLPTVNHLSASRQEQAKIPSGTVCLRFVALGTASSGVEMKFDQR
jgi:hypothetical protein